MQITTLGVDLAKSVFQLHGIDESGKVVLRKKVRRGALLDVLSSLAPCLIGMEACATSHYWAREIAAMGHEGSQPENPRATRKIMVPHRFGHTQAVDQPHPNQSHTSVAPKMPSPITSIP